MQEKVINSALISVYHKEGLDKIAQKLDELNVKIYSTGGTQTYIESLGIDVHTVEDLTSYPSILDGRVKTLHPKVFGGILAKRQENHLEQLSQYDIPELDLVIVDLYPFEETVANTDDDEEIIEKIDIGGISLIRAAAKNFNDLVVISSRNQYQELIDLLDDRSGITTIQERKDLARQAFATSSDYDQHIFQYFNGDNDDYLKISEHESTSLRYGENPHQKAKFFGNLSEKFEKLSGKELSYNNLVDVDACIELMREFKDQAPTFCVLKHTNACGVATRPTIAEAWDDALAGDPVSAFGGVLISNSKIDLFTAKKIDSIFYEVLIAPDYDSESIVLLSKKKKRILLQLKNFDVPEKRVKSLLNGFVEQENDLHYTPDIKVVTKQGVTDEQMEDLKFADIIAKHLKSNTIVIAKNKQLLGMGCGQTSRVDACKQAIDKAARMGFTTKDAVLASDAFFPFPDCVELAHEAGITAVTQPGGSIKDNLSIDKCDEYGMSMIFTGIRHFRH